MTAEDTITVIDEQTGNATDVDSQGNPVEQQHEPDMSGINVEGEDLLGDALQEEIKVVADKDMPDANQPGGMPGGQPGGAPNQPTSELDEVRAELAALREERQAAKEQAERDKKVKEIEQKGYEVAKEHNQLKAAKQAIMSSPGAFKNGQMTAEVVAKIVDIDSKITQLAAQHVAIQNQVEEAKKVPEPTETKHPEAYLKWRQANAHWIDNPMYADMRAAAGAIETAWKQQNNGNPESPVFWDAVIQQLQADGWQVPGAGGYQNSGAPRISNSRFGGPNAAGGANPAARRQTGGPTTGVGKSSQTTQRTGPNGWTNAELKFAKMFGNDKGDEAKMLSGQYSRNRVGGSK